jgi:hypothetical protein
VTNATSESAEVSQNSPGTPLKEKIPLTNSSLKWYFKGSRVLSRLGKQWLSLKIGYEIALDTFLLLDPIASSSVTLISPEDLRTLQLPETSVSYRAAETLADDGFHSNFSMAEPRVYYEIIRMAHALRKDSSPSCIQIATEACVWALHGIANSRSTHVSGLRAESEVYVTRARGLLARIPETVDLEALECVVLLVGVQHGRIGSL